MKGTESRQITVFSSNTKFTCLTPRQELASESPSAVTVHMALPPEINGGVPGLFIEL